MSGRNTAAHSDDEEGTEADFGDDENDVDAHVPEESEDEDDEFNEDEAMVDDDLDDHPDSLVVKVNVTPPKLKGVMASNEQAANLQAPNNSEQAGEKPASKGPFETQSSNNVNTDLKPQDGSKASLPVDKNDRPATPSAVDGSAQTSTSPPLGHSATSLAFRGSPEKRPAQLA